ncbi:MAG: AlbA family DNA-binding domain-containing protein [Solirubrobacteraceae bacterium]
MQQLFDSPWDALDGGSVERFLSTARDEGLTWEAKGGTAPHPDSVRKAVCGFANALGGYLILGAERSGEGWALPGLEFPSPEPGTWTSSVISSGGVSPLPIFEAKPFPREDDRQAVVVRVEPIANPPCITASGAVFVRVSGQTVPVTDQRVLADLIQRGAAARAQAEGNALRAAQDLVRERGQSVFAVALCSLGGPEDKAAVLFDKQRAETFYELAIREVPPRATDGYSWHPSVHQDSIRLTLDSTGNNDDPPLQTTAAAAYWDGTVAAFLNHADGNYTVADLINDAQRFWRMLGHATRIFASAGDAHLALVMNTEHQAVQRGGADVPRTDIRRWTEAREPTLGELASLDREISRAFGRAHWEPTNDG